MLMPINQGAFFRGGKQTWPGKPVIHQLLNFARDY